MKVHLALLFLFFNCVRTTENVFGIFPDQVSEQGLSNSRFAFDPWRHNSLSLSKRDVVPQVGQTEGGPVKQDPGLPQAPPVKPIASEANKTAENLDPVAQKVSVLPVANSSSTTIAPAVNVTSAPVATVVNTTASTTKEAPSQLDLNNPGVLKRGLIVFGGFALLAVAYYVFFRRNHGKSSSNNAHNPPDQNQFRYGVLPSGDQRDNLELSRIPLTMDSDEDDDEDLEIFDLGQKKKSLSYVNLQPSFEDINIASSHGSDGKADHDNLLLDIDTNDHLINWSQNSHHDSNFDTNFDSNFGTTIDLNTDTNAD
ncbi:uncharacterized protein LOC105397347 [Plutella xylostella]|uniref:uncharacterized protein LOC105397347 n=1 Tax=Plutella xylostella TaxID=51655 RepID=UPI002032596E|nr:uncharacterized protein LOC105397347 [Plutella xylostella]